MLAFTSARVPGLPLSLALALLAGPACVANFESPPVNPEPVDEPPAPAASASWVGKAAIATDHYATATATHLFESGSSFDTTLVMRSEIVTAWVWVNALPLPGNTPTWEPKARLRLAIARSVLDEPNAIYGDEDFEIIPMQLARVSEVNGSAFTVTTDDGTVVRVEDTHLAILALGTSSAATYAAWQAGTMAPFAWQRFELNQDGCDAYSSSRHMRRLEFALPAAAYDVIDAPVAASGTKLVQVHTSRGGLSLVCEPSTSAYPGCRAYLSAADIVDVDATRTIYAGAISHPSLETLRAWFPAEIELACNAGTCDFAFAQARP